MNIFQIHEQILTQYRRYIESFLSIADSQIRTFVQHVSRNFPISRQTCATPSVSSDALGSQVI